MRKFVIGNYNISIMSSGYISQNMTLNISELGFLNFHLIQNLRKKLAGNTEKRYQE